MVTFFYRIVMVECQSFCPERVAVFMPAFRNDTIDARIICRVFLAFVFTVNPLR